MDVNVFRELVREITRVTGLLGKQKPIYADLTTTQYHILIEIGQGASRQIDLAMALVMDPASLSRSLSLLESKNLIKKEMNPESKREYLVSLTELGFTRLHEVNKQMEQVYSEMLQTIPDDNMDELERNVKLLINAIKHEKVSSFKKMNEKNGAEKE